MTSQRCPQCSAAVAADATHCDTCGYPLAWQAAQDEEATAAVPDMVRLPGEVDGGPNDLDATREVAPPAAPRPPDVPPGPTVTCAACGTANPAGRTLCERCGAGLLSATDLVDDEPWWRARGVLPLALLALVVGVAVGGWLVVRAGAEQGPPDATTGGEAAGDAAADGQAGAGEQGAEAGGGQGEGSAGGTGDGAARQDAEVVLEVGDNGAEVRAWQEALRAAGLDVAVDGDFGPGTEDATRRFQGSINEEPTGQVTTRTLAAGERAASLRVVEVYLLESGQLRAVRKRVDEGQLVNGVVERLFGAPTDAERARGLSTAIPRGATVGAVTLDLGMVTIELRGFAAGGDAAALQQRVDQVVASVTELSSVDSVQLQLPPPDAQVFADAGIDLSRPLDGGDA